MRQVLKDSLFGRGKSILAIMVALGLFLSAILIGVVSPANAAEDLFSDKFYIAINNATTSSAIVSTQAEVDAAVAEGFTDVAPLFMASKTPKTGLVPVYSVYKASSKNTLLTLSSSERDSAIRGGFENRGIAMYVNAKAASGTEPVQRFQKGARHRFAISTEDKAALAQAGWRLEGTPFYAKLPVNEPIDPVEPVVDGKFSIAVMPDTQQEVHDFSGTQFANRTQWIVNQVQPKDLRMALHTGDVVSAGGNSDADSPAQYVIASNAFNNLDNANLSYLVAPGNHDTKSVCGSGSACNTSMTRAWFRDTTVFNTYFSTSRLKLANEQTFEQGKSDNSYKTFTAEGTKWLVLSLEMYPRVAVVNWAQSVVQNHPGHNVIVSTHYLLEANGAISTSVSYGDTSGRYLYDNLLLKYPNIRLAFSGHTGQAASRTDTGVNGNKVAAFVGAFHQNDFNPTRIVTIDTVNNTVTSDIQAATVRPAYLKKYPGTQLPTYDQFDVSYDTMNYVRP